MHRLLSSTVDENVLDRKLRIHYGYACRSVNLFSMGLFSTNHLTFCEETKRDLSRYGCKQCQFNYSTTYVPG